MNKFIMLVLCIFATNTFAQKCNHAREVQSLFSQLEANGFDTKQAIKYDYYFLDNDSQKLVNLKNALQNQGYRFVSMNRKNAKYELIVEKQESHSAQSLIKRGEELSRLSKAQNIETFDGFEIKIEENEDNNGTFKNEVERTPVNDLFKKATQLYDARQDADAIMVFDRCIKLGINPAESYYKRANSKTALGKKTEAIIDLENAIRLNPAYFEANYNLAGLYFDNKNFDKAATYYQKATTLNPRNDNAFYRLAVAQNLLGQRSVALQNCQKALQINANNEYAKELLKKLK